MPQAMLTRYQIPSILCIQSAKAKPGDVFCLLSFAMLRSVFMVQFDPPILHQSKIETSETEVRHPEGVSFSLLTKSSQRDRIWKGAAGTERPGLNPSNPATVAKVLPFSNMAKGNIYLGFEGADLKVFGCCWCCSVKARSIIVEKMLPKPTKNKKVTFSMGLRDFRSEI